MDIGKTHIAPAESKCGLRVLDSEQIQHGRMQIVHLTFVAHGVISPFIGFAVNRSAANPSASQPYREAEWIVIATVRTLSKGSSSKLASPHHQCRV